MKAWQMGLGSVLLCCGLVVPAWAGDHHGWQCKVTDPTGTPLNVRATPNGVKKGTLRNGTKVIMTGDSTDSKGRSWALVHWEGGQRLKGYAKGDDRAYEGWVIREYISCKVD